VLYQAVFAIINSMKYVDLHQDLFWYSQNPDYIKGDTQTSWEQIKDKSLISFNSLNDWFSPEDFSLIEKNLDSLPDGFEYVKDKAMLLDNKPGRIIAHIEGLTGFEDVDEHWKTLERWKEKGLRSVAPVWNNTNSFGGGTKDHNKNSGLTTLGEKFVTWCLNNNLIVDLAHANEKTFYDMSDIVLGEGKPLFVSHGNSLHVYSDKDRRNYDDEQIKLIAKSGGVVGVFFANSFISDKEEVSLEDLYLHIEHIVNIGGIDCIAIGSDFGGISHGSPQGLSSVADMDNLIDFLLSKGWSISDVEKMFYQDAMRVIESLLA